jgi:hypothetical protein
MNGVPITPVLHRPIKFTVFFSYAADVKREEEMTPAVLAERIRVTTAREKDRLPWLKLATFGDLKSDKASLRHDANVIAISGIEADYDAGLVTFDDAQERLEKQGLAAIIYTSPSHTAATPRWRVLCPFSTSKGPQHRSHMMGRLNGLFGGIFARESWTLSQAYYFGAVRRNPDHRVELIDGEPIDLHDDLDETWLGKPGVVPGARPDEVAIGEARGDAELVSRIVSGAGFHVEMCALAARYIARGMTRFAVIETLRGLMLSHPDAARDTRWNDRFASIPGLVNSAETKFIDDTRVGRREVARLISRMMREQCAAADMRAAALAEADRHGLPPKVAKEIVAWICRQERARMGGNHA